MGRRKRKGLYEDYSPKEAQTTKHLATCLTYLMIESALLVSQSIKPPTRKNWYDPHPKNTSTTSKKTRQNQTSSFELVV
jgi:hypothetical protein